MRFNTVFVCVQTREYSRLVPYVRIQTHEPPQSIRRPPAPHAALLVAQPTTYRHLLGRAGERHRQRAHRGHNGHRARAERARHRSWLVAPRALTSSQELQRLASQARYMGATTDKGTQRRERTMEHSPEPQCEPSRKRHQWCRTTTRPRARLAGGHRGPGRPFEGYLTASWEGWLMSLGGFQSDIGLVGGTVHRALAVHLLH